MERWRGGADAITGVGLAGYVHGSGSTFMVSATPIGHGFAVQISVPFDPTRWQAWVASALTFTAGAAPETSNIAGDVVATTALRVGVTRVGVTASFSVGPDGRIGPASVSLGPIQTVAECTYDELARALTKPADAASRYPGVPLCRLAQTVLTGRGEGASDTARNPRRTSGIDSGRDVVTELERLGDAVFTAWATVRGLPLIKLHSWEVRTVAAMPVRIDLAVEPSAREGRFDTPQASFTSGLRETADGLNVWTVAADLGDQEAPFSAERMRILAAHYAGPRQSGRPASKHGGADVPPLPGVLDPQMSTADLLGHLNGAGFEQYLAAATATAEVAPGVAEQVWKRLNNNTLTPASALIVLTGAVGPSWQPLREQVWRWVQADPARAVDVLEASRTLIQAPGWSQLKLHTARASVVTTRYGPVTSYPHVGTSPRDTLAPAAIGLLARVAGLPLPIGPTQPDLSSAQAPTGGSRTSTDARLRLGGRAANRPIDSITPEAYAAARQGPEWVTREVAGVVLAAAMSGRNVPPDVAGIIMHALVTHPALALEAIRRQAWPEVGLVPAAVSSVPLLGSGDPRYAAVIGTAAVRQPDGGITASVVPGVTQLETENAAALRLAGDLLGIPTRADVLPLRAAAPLGQNQSATTAYSTIPDTADLLTFVALGGELPLDTRVAALMVPTAIDAAMSLLLSDPGRRVHVELVPSGNGERRLEAHLVVQYPGRRAIIRARSPQFSRDDAAARIWSLRILHARALDIDGVASRLMQQGLICTATERPMDAQLVAALVLLALDGVPLPEPVEAQCFQWIAAQPGRALEVIAAAGTGAVGWAKCWGATRQPLTMAGASMTRSDGTEVSVPVVIGKSSEAAGHTAAVTVLAQLLHQKTMESLPRAVVQPLIEAMQTALAEGRELSQTVAGFDIGDLADLLSYSALGGPIPATVANAIVELAARREIAPERALHLIHHPGRALTTAEPTSHPRIAGSTVAVEQVALGDMVFSSGPVEGLRELQVRHAALATLIARLLHVPPPDYSESLLPVAYRAAAHTPYSLLMWQCRVPWRKTAEIIFGRMPRDPMNDANLRIDRVHIFTANRLLEPHDARMILYASVSEFETECTEVRFETTWLKPRYPLDVEHFTSIARATVAGVQYESPPFVEETHLRAEDLAAACLLEMIWGQHLGGPGTHALQ